MSGPFGSSQWMYNAGSAYEIDNSLRFEDGDSASLSKSFASNGNLKKFTWSFWVKRNAVNVDHKVVGSSYTSSSEFAIRFEDTGELRYFSYADGGGSASYELITTRLFRDPSAWYHIVFVWDTAQSTAADRVKIYVNGVQETSFGTANYPAEDYDGIYNLASHTFFIGGDNDDNYFNGYISEVNVIDGLAKVPADFGETGDYGEWKPKAYSGSYGTNGFYLDFSNDATKHTITANGAVKHSTTVAKIGASSIYFDGTGHNTTTGNHISPATSFNSFEDSDFTIEGWIYPTATNTRVFYAHGNNDDNNYFRIDNVGANPLMYLVVGGTDKFDVQTSGSPITINQWNHLAVARLAGTITLYVNGTAEATVSYSAAMPVWTNGGTFGIRKSGGRYWEVFHGYMDELRISNKARYTGNFTPSTSAFTEDSNTLLLIHSDTTNNSTTFTDSSGVVGGLGNDQSGGEKHWTANNITYADQMLDSPTNNFATWNPLLKTLNADYFEEGNLLGGSTSDWVTILSTIAVSTGKWYWETSEFTGTNVYNGAIVSSVNTQQYFAPNESGAISYKANGYLYVEGTTTASWGASYGTTDIIGVALDLDSSTRTVKFYKNNALQGTVNLTSNFTGSIVPWITTHSCSAIANFGQDSSFAGAKTAQGNQDGNNIGDFYYTPPSGFLALCTKNLPDVAVIPSEHFNTVLYTGNSGTNAITGVGFQPDFTWLKARDVADVHALFDSVRGVNKRLYSHANSAEMTGSNQLDSWGTDGFTLGADGAEQVNLNTKSYVAWNWKAGNATLASNAFTQGSIASTCSRNVDAGFSIVSWTGTGTAGTVGHGLSSAPDIVIVKRRNATAYWYMNLKNIPSQSAQADMVGVLNETLAIDGYNVGSAIFSNLAPTSTLFNITTNAVVNANASTYIAYAFHSVDGYSKVGSYTGNGSTDGTFVYTGFRPAYVMLKRTDGVTHWQIQDTARSTYNVSSKGLLANTTDTEADAAVYNLDMLSNGFKIRATHAGQNANGANYIFLAFSEQPFKYSNAR